MQPQLYGLRAQTAAKAVEQGVGLLAQLRQPAFEAFGPHGATDQLMAQCDGGRLPLLLEAGTDLGPLIIRHQRQIGRAGEGPFLELDGGTQVDKRDIIQKNPGQIRGEWQLAHRRTSKDVRARSVSIASSC